MHERETIDIPPMNTIGRVSHTPYYTDEFRPTPDNLNFVMVLTEGLAVVLHASRPQRRLILPAGLEPEDQVYTIEPGFLFDGASVRYRWANAALPRWGVKTLPAAAVHDWFYSDGRHLIPADVKDRRLWADQLFYKLLRAAGANAIRARIAYRAVRIFGSAVWNKGQALGYDQPTITKWTHRPNL